MQVEMNPDIKVTRMMLTPAVAKSFLERNTANRACNKSTVKFLIQEMQEGRWCENGDTICFRKNDTLANGQHRCHAVAESGIAIPIILVEGIDSEAMETIDIGRRRSSGDALQLNGEVNANLLAAALTLVERFYTKQINRSKSQFSPKKVMSVLERHPGVRDSVAFISHLKRPAGMPLSVAAGLHYIFSRISPESKQDADTFWRGVLEGVGLEQGSPILVLRSKLLDNSRRTVRFQQDYITGLCIRAWNHYRSGNRITFLRYSPGGSDDVPVPY